MELLVKSPSAIGRVGLLARGEAAACKIPSLGTGRSAVDEHRFWIELLAMEKSVSNLDLVYGNSVHGTVCIDGAVRVTDLSRTSPALPQHSPSGTQLDLSEAITAALSAPIEFPALELAIVPGDRVVLAVDPNIPRMAEVVQHVIAYLQRQGIATDQFSVVLAGQAEADVLALTSVLPAEIAVELHDADDQTKVAYVAANKQGDPIYMNRSLVDADVVIPIMCARGRHAIDYEGAYGVFPLLTDRRTRGQFFSLRQLADPSEHQRLTEWADEAAWWVGLLVAIQVVPAPDGGVARVLSGSPQPLEAEVQDVMSDLWQTEVDRSFDSVIALIDGGPAQQTWNSVARAIAAASPLVSHEGALIICTELSQRPGPALRKLNNPNRSEDALAKQLSSDASDDALAAAVLLESLESTHVYLLSNLPREVVESLGMSAIENLHQAEHIIQQRGSCLVVGSAQHRTLRGSKRMALGESAAAH